MRIFADALWRIEKIHHTHSTPPEGRFTQRPHEDRPRSWLYRRHLRLALEHKVGANLFDHVVLVDVNKGRWSTTGLKVEMRQRSTSVDVKNFDPSVIVDDDCRRMSDVLVSAVGLHSSILDPNKVLAFKVNDILQLGKLCGCLVGLNVVAHDCRLAQVAQVELCVSYVSPRVGLHK